jgi:hypothetical protein
MRHCSVTHGFKKSTNDEECAGGNNVEQPRSADVVEHDHAKQVPTLHT